MSKHTPGPWLIAENGKTFVYALGTNQTNVFWCDVQSAGSEKASDQEKQANAALIAAAPDLLEALIGALDHWPVPSSICKDRPAYEAACAAVLKATGEQL